jgi:hypothetical protein
VKKTGIAVIAIALLSGCSTRGNLTPQELTSLREQVRVLEVQKERCSNFGAYAFSELINADDEDRKACYAKCSALPPVDPKAEAAIMGVQSLGDPRSEACYHLFPECRDPIFNQVEKRLDEENPNATEPPQSVLNHSIDQVEPERAKTRCDYLSDKIYDLHSRIYYGDPANCAGPCWMD